jgi:hypothetical protein
MKMPRRPFFPLANPPPDIFGLHWLTLAEDACETVKERAQRAAKVEAGVGAAYGAAVRHLGEEEARKLFRSVMRRRKRGANKESPPDRDQRLLAAYDERTSGESVAALARRLHDKFGVELGNSPKAIETQIGKLRDELNKRRRAAAVQERLWRMATRHEPPTLLADIGRKK